MERHLFYPATTTSCFIAETPLDGLKPIRDPDEFLLLGRDGRPGVHPSMPDGHVLVAKLTLRSGRTTAWVCNNLDMMDRLWALTRDITSDVTSVEWLTGHNGALDVQPCEVTVMWSGGWDDYMVDPTSCRDMTAEERKLTAGTGFYTPNDHTHWLHCSFLGPVFSPLGETQVVGIIKWLRGGK